jgi:5-methylcytosine-specific restriction endonuclease McrA
MKFNPQPKPEKTPKKEKKPIKRSALKRNYKPTGESSIFEAVLDGISDMEETKCFVCGIRVAVVTHNNMAHVLSKKQYPKFRLNPKNIVILCHRIIADEHGFQGCHFSYDMTPHSQLKGEGWEKLFELREQLKQEYKELDGNN